jgi:hypothetical protein
MGKLGPSNWSYCEEAVFACSAEIRALRWSHHLRSDHNQSL